ncbi:hypothetical protein [Thalassotalea sp. PLHSN55]|uniref:hypothetical protein n=1 Tax=Thalassotalea sp. PLHSN55 TaxID=3435888 RepID=UPI003F87BE8B
MVCLFVMLIGCSVNNVGLPGSVNQQVIHSPMAKIIHTEARGFHLNTQNGVEFQIGIFEKALIYPVVSQQPLSCAEFMLNTGASTDISTDTNTDNNADTNTDYVSQENRAEYGAEPIKTTLRAQGLGLYFSSYAFGFSLGALNRHVTRINTQDSLQFFYRNNAKNYPHVCAVVQPKPQGNTDEN